MLCAMCWSLLLRCMALLVSCEVGRAALRGAKKGNAIQAGQLWREGLLFLSSCARSLSTVASEIPC